MKKSAITQKGFTLIELLTTMTIIAVLIGLALVSYQGTRKAARDGKRKADLEAIRGELEIYRADNRAYPEVSGDASSVLSALLGDIPSDPVPGFHYYYGGTAGSYALCASLEVSGGVVAGCGSCGDSACNYKVVSP